MVHAPVSEVATADPPRVAVFHVTALSNFVRGYDKFARRYDKARIPESTFPDRFFLLDREELHIGIAKARHLPAKTGLPGDRLIAIETRLPPAELHPNLRTRLGRYVSRGFVQVHAVHFVEPDGSTHAVSVEELYACSYRTHEGRLSSFESLRPRSVSVLPIARACQARCPFCFSRASVSAGTLAAPPDWPRIREVLSAARQRGAERAVITGGGEPTLMRSADLLRLVGLASSEFPRVVLITNGAVWGGLEEAARVEALEQLAQAGLSVLSISRHHHDPEVNTTLMGLDTQGDAIARSWSLGRARWPGLRLRWVCVLQRGGVEDRASLARYLDFCVRSGVEEVCFKELYVSTSVESEYHDRAANAWSAEHQVPLSLVLDFANEHGWTTRETLPWGSPIFEGRWAGRVVRVAAYTEPSLLWELDHGIARSWNLMADGRCLASLEHNRSEILRHGLLKLPTMS